MPLEDRAARRYTMLALRWEQVLGAVASVSREAQYIEVLIGDGSGEDGLKRLGGPTRVQRILCTRDECP